MSRDERATGRAAEIEAQRILCEYRRLVLLGRARLPLAEARRLVGPDCAFHLYFRHARTPPAAGPPVPKPAPRHAQAGRRRRAKRARPRR